jgi:hyperosmotically inducible periplasmic protein
MGISKRLATVAAVALCLGLLPVHLKAAPQEPDNTSANKRDRNAGEPTADQQKMNPEDRALTKKIRASLEADKSLSTYAHNIKIISQNGKVTLKGPVRTEQEKTAIETKAAEVAGSGNVENRLDVVPKQ